jgi:hypothetical protein
MLFRYWNHTTCIDYDNIDDLEKAIIQLLEKEKGCHRIHQLPSLNYDAKQLKLKPWDKLPTLWIIALSKSLSGWTVIKTFPKGLFCRRAYGYSHSRLSDLTEELNCKAFYLEVHHDNPEFLLEADARGYTFLSCCPGAENSDRVQLYEEQVDLSSLIQKFSLIEVSDSFKAAMNINKAPIVKKQTDEAEELMKKIDAWEYEEFDLITKASQTHTERIDHKLAEAICNNNYFWYIKNLAYSAYNDSEKLIADNVKLLYFNYF